MPDRWIDGLGCTRLRERNNELQTVIAHNTNKQEYRRTSYSPSRGNLQYLLMSTVYF